MKLKISVSILGIKLPVAKVSRVFSTTSQSLLNAASICRLFDFGDGVDQDFKAVAASSFMKKCTSYMITAS